MLVQHTDLLTKVAMGSDLAVGLCEVPSREEEVLDFWEINTLHKKNTTRR